MDLYLGFIPIYLIWVGFFFSILMAIHSIYPFLPLQWVGWGKRKSTSKFDVKNWQGQEYYRLCDAAALWVELPPDRPDDPHGFVGHRLWFLIWDIRSGDLECDKPDDVKHEIGNLKLLLETPISADALREYASKQGKMPEFLK